MNSVWEGLTTKLRLSSAYNRIALRVITHQPDACVPGSVVSPLRLGSACRQSELQFPRAVVAVQQALQRACNCRTAIARWRCDGGA